MDFDEPGLEELIESNLHSEMKKILDESDSENIIAQSSVPSEVVTLSSETGKMLACGAGHSVFFYYCFC